MPREETAKREDTLGRKRSTTRRGFGAVRKLSSGRYQASYVKDGTRYCAPTTYTTIKMADSWLSEIDRQIQLNIWKPPTAKDAELFRNYSEAWLKKPRRKPLSPVTVRNYREDIKRMERFAELRLTDISAAMIRQWHSDITETGGATSAGRATRALRAIMNQAVQDELITRNPVPNELARTTAGRAQRIPTPKEMDALVDALRESRFGLALILGAYAGLRIGEWRALRRMDFERTSDGYTVNVERQAQHVDGQWHILPPKSEKGNRKVAIPDGLTAFIDNHLEKYVGDEPTDLIFTSGGTGDFADQAWRRAWAKAKEDAGVPVTAGVFGHQLRHRYATELANAGTTAIELQSALGHASIATSMMYVHRANGADARIASRLKAPATILAEAA